MKKDVDKYYETTVKHKFNYSELVYIRTDLDQVPCIIVGILIKSDDVVQYMLSMGLETIIKSGIELSRTKDDQLISDYSSVPREGDDD